ncbi:hypothetical protein BB560_002812 [Smittium megazygosporum]|uniref:Mitochondrial thiamine pyrophosphate carrier 1 n=1 Tax=Smittium megazygosporum TaxID=133381 RepID=A0A2T9ZDU8_9FUNG|nr:hypothetical protein BB560_002812 [Smittium megazygosporum]
MPQRELTSLEKLFCGGFAGLFSRIVISPFDVVKIDLQLQQSLKLSSSLSKKYGILSSIKKIYSTDGFKGFYKGNISALFLYVSYSSTQFYMFSQSQNFLNKYSLYKKTSTFLAGSIAGLSATVVTYPFDLLRTRFAAQSSNNKAYFSYPRAVISIYKHEGVLGFYKGLGSATFQIVPYMGIVFLSFEAIHSFLLKLDNKNSVLSNVVNTSFAGASAGVIGKFCVYPLDLIRKRTQVQGPSLYKFVEKDFQPYSNKTFTMFKKTFANEGVYGLYKGLSPSLIKASVSSASAFLAYNLSQNFFLKYF